MVMQAGIFQKHAKAFELLTHAALSYSPLVGVIMSLITNRHVYYHSIEFVVIYHITNVGGRRTLDRNTSTSSSRMQTSNSNIGHDPNCAALAPYS